MTLYLFIYFSYCSLENGGVPAKFVIIDDGWQSVGMDPSGVEWKAADAAKWVFVSFKFSNQFL